jgi:hypothetical protein
MSYEHSYHDALREIGELREERDRFRNIVAKIAWHNAQNGQDALAMRELALSEMRRELRGS